MISRYKGHGCYNAHCIKIGEIQVEINPGLIGWYCREHASIFVFEFNLEKGMKIWNEIARRMNITLSVNLDGKLFKKEIKKNKILKK